MSARAAWRMLRLGALGVGVIVLLGLTAAVGIAHMIEPATTPVVNAGAASTAWESLPRLVWGLQPTPGGVALLIIAAIVALGGVRRGG